MQMKQNKQVPSHSITQENSNQCSHPDLHYQKVFFSCYFKGSYNEQLCYQFGGLRCVLHCLPALCRS
jgi:hypothetical protein